MSHKHKIRERLFAEQDGRCHLCGGPMVLFPSPMRNPVPPDAATIDHIVPAYQCGRKVTAPGNVALAHYRCNVRRGRRLLTEL